MKAIIKKFKVKKVIQSGNCQELFYQDDFLKAQTSIKIIRIDKDIASMLKKSFLGKCKSEIEIHYLGGYPIKLSLDGVLLNELHEEDYPRGLKLLLAKELEVNQEFSQKVQSMLQEYPLRSNLEIEPFSLNSILLRAYACSIFDKLSTSQTTGNDVGLHRCALIFDLLKFIDNNHNRIVSNSNTWPNLLEMKNFWFWCYPYNSSEEFVKTLNLQGLKNINEQISRYLYCWVSEFIERFQLDDINLTEFIIDHYGLLSNKQIDRQLIMQYDRPLNICLPFDSIPDFLTEKPLSTPELKHYLSKQNW